MKLLPKNGVENANTIGARVCALLYVCAGIVDNPKKHWKWDDEMQLLRWENAFAEEKEKNRNFSFDKH